MHAATQGAIINFLPPFLYFLNADSLILGAQLIHLRSKQQHILFEYLQLMQMQYA